jgi:2-keto-4-pentenoate hydratase/2-oxohepta-3-ene-1,7-dioic acid hydratase in catechol pathway
MLYRDMSEHHVAGHEPLSSWADALDEADVVAAETHGEAVVDEMAVQAIAEFPVRGVERRGPKPKLHLTRPSRLQCRNVGQGPPSEILEYDRFHLLLLFGSDGRRYTVHSMPVQPLRLGRLIDGRTVVATKSGSVVTLEDAIGQGVDGADALSGALDADGRGNWISLIEGWGDLSPIVRQLAETADGTLPTLREEELQFAAPLPAPSVRIFALGGNFAKHLADASKTVYGEGSDMHTELMTKRREQGPWGFITLPETVIGHDAPVKPPTGLTKIDYEGEVAVILARGGRSLADSDVRIWGFTAWNDFSLRDSALGVGPAYDKGPMNWTLQKNFDSGSSCGPWVVVDDDGSHKLNDLRIALRVNGEVRQDGSTSDMIFTFAETAAHLSHFLTLRPGDVIASGTPAGTALESGVDGPFLKDGDVTELEVEGVGVLRNALRTGKEQ